MTSLISRKKTARLTFQFLPIEEQLNIINLRLAFDESKHPRDHGKFTYKNSAGKFAKKGPGKAGRQFKRNKEQRYEIKEGQTASEAYSGAVNRAKQLRDVKRKVNEPVRYALNDVRKQKEFNKASRKFAAGVESWHEQERIQRNIDKAAQAREESEERGGEEGLGKELTRTAAMEGGSMVGMHFIHKVFGKAKSKFSKGFRKIFGKESIKQAAASAEGVAEKVDLGKAGKQTKAAVSGFNRKGVFKSASQKDVQMAAVKSIYNQARDKGATHEAASKSAKVAFKAFSKDAHKAFVNNTAKAVAGAATTEAATSIATKAVGSSMFWRAAKAVGMVGTTLASPQIAVPLAIAAAVGYVSYKVSKKRAREQEIMSHERELMRLEAQRPQREENEERAWHENLRTQTAREIARQASIYATKQYARQEMKEKTAAIDEELAKPKTQKKIKKSARITAHAAAKEYANKERASAYKQRSSDSYFYRLS